jgi:hypothetical protein
VAELREGPAQIGDRSRRLTGVLVDDRRPGLHALAAMRNEDPLVLMDVPGRKQRVAAEQPREQLLFLDVERHHRREVGLPRRYPLAAGNGRAFEHLGDRARICRRGLSGDETKNLQAWPAP